MYRLMYLTAILGALLVLSACGGVAFVRTADEVPGWPTAKYLHQQYGVQP